MPEFHLTTAGLVPFFFFFFDLVYLSKMLGSGGIFLFLSLFSEWPIESYHNGGS